MTSATSNAQYGNYTWTAPTAPTAPSAPAGLWAGAERAVSATGAAARLEVLRALRAAGFRVETEQLGLIAASRGSHLSAATLQPEKLPMTITVRITDTATGCALSIALADRGLGAFGRPMGAEGAYRSAFEHVLATLDAALCRTDPSARGTFSEPRFSSPAGLTYAPAGFVQAGAGLLHRINTKLDGAPSGAAQRKWHGVDGACIVGPDGVANLDLAALQMMSTVGLQAINRPASMPDDISAAGVGELISRFDERLNASASVRTAVRIDIAAEQVPVVEFLHEQARIRELVALRTLERCVTCRFEKVSNPDYKDLQNKIRKTKMLSGSFGGIITGHGISPFVLVGKLVQAKKFDPDYVCPRCQGLHAETSILTFCPGCGDRRDEAVLTSCPRCHHDFRADLPEQMLWQAELPANATAYAATGMGWSVPKHGWQSPEVSSLAPAAWYPDPYGSPQLRWWDGSSWTGHVHPQAAGPDTP